MSTAEMKRIVDNATAEEQHFLFVCLSEKLYPNTQEQLHGLDRRREEMEAGKGTLSLAEFEKRLDRPARN
jgi:hypothetical protein